MRNRTPSIQPRNEEWPIHVKRGGPSLRWISARSGATSGAPAPGGWTFRRPVMRSRIPQRRIARAPGGRCAGSRFVNRRSKTADYLLVVVVLPLAVTVALAVAVVVTLAVAMALAARVLMFFRAAPAPVLV